MSLQPKTYNVEIEIYDTGIELYIGHQPTEKVKKYARTVPRIFDFWPKNKISDFLFGEWVPSLFLYKTPTTTTTSTNSNDDHN